MKYFRHPALAFWAAVLVLGVAGLIVAARVGGDHPAPEPRPSNAVLIADVAGWRSHLATLAALGGGAVDDRTATTWAAQARPLVAAGALNAAGDAELTGDWAEAGAAVDRFMAAKPGDDRIQAGRRLYRSGDRLAAAVGDTAGITPGPTDDPAPDGPGITAPATTALTTPSLPQP